MQVRQNRLEHLLKYGRGLGGSSLVCSRPSSVWVRPALCRRNANAKVFPSARLENSVQATVLGRHEVCLTPVRTSSNSQQSTMQCTLPTTPTKTSNSINQSTDQQQQTTFIFNKLANNLQLPTQSTSNDF